MNNPVIQTLSMASSMPVLTGIFNVVDRKAGTMKWHSYMEFLAKWLWT